MKQWKNNKRKIDEESLQLFALVKKATEKLMNPISNFEELKCEKSWNIIQQKLKGNLIWWTTKLIKT